MDFIDFEESYSWNGIRLQARIFRMLIFYIYKYFFYSLCFLVLTADYGYLRFSDGPATPDKIQKLCQVDDKALTFA